MSMSSVGLTGMEQVIRIGVDGRSPRLFSARLDCFLDPGPSLPARFEDVIKDTVRELALDEAGMRAERLAERVAHAVLERQQARRAEVTVALRFPESAQRISTLYGRAVASERGTRWTVGVAARGVTSSPYADDEAAARLAARGFSKAQIARIAAALPVATHSQMSAGTLHLGCPEGCALDVDAAVLLAIVGASLSGDAGHGVRAMIAGVVERFASAPDEVFVAAAQETLETIHGHDVCAQRAGALGDLRRELAGGRAAPHETSLREWLAAG
jgi:GTP cyclohydrolase I/GTP cyclohydrolase-4